MLSTGGHTGALSIRGTLDAGRKCRCESLTSPSSKFQDSIEIEKVFLNRATNKSKAGIRLVRRRIQVSRSCDLDY